MTPQSPRHSHRPRLNWIVMPVHNALAHTMRAVPSLFAQDIPGGVALLVIDNDSADGSRAWLQSLSPSPPTPQIQVITIRPQRGVAHAWNVALSALMTNGVPAEPYVLVVNNDVILRPDTYRYLVADGGPFVTAVGNHDPESIEPPYSEPDPNMTRPHPDFSCFLIRLKAWREIGPFDEEFKIAYGEDADYHCRMKAAGIEAKSIDLPFLHVGSGSGTLKSAPLLEQEAIRRQADLNRQYFKNKWGFGIGSPEYYQWFGHGKPE